MGIAHRFLLPFGSSYSDRKAVRRTLKLWGVLVDALALQLRLIAGQAGGQASTISPAMHSSLFFPRIFIYFTRNIVTEYGTILLKNASCPLSLPLEASQ